jgi:hypothetical protein
MMPVVEGVPQAEQFQILSHETRSSDGERAALILPGQNANLDRRLNASDIMLSNAL